MTKGLDITYDAGLFGAKPECKLYTRLIEDNGEFFFNQYLPDKETTDMIIPVGFDCHEGGLVTFSARLTSLPSGYKAILEDRLLKTFTDLKVPGAKYELIINSGIMGTGRFYLHTMGTPTGISLQEDLENTIYAVNKEIYIKGFVSESAIAYVYDIMGRKIADYQLEPSEMNILNVYTLKGGIYIVKVLDKGVVNTEKVYISE